MKIDVYKKYIKIIATEYDYSIRSVYHALNFERYSMKARKIRFDAMNKYHGTFIN